MKKPPPRQPRMKRQYGWCLVYLADGKPAENLVWIGHRPKAMRGVERVARVCISEVKP